MTVSPHTSVLVEIFEGSQAEKSALEALQCPCTISAAAVAEAYAQAEKNGVSTAKIMSACKTLGTVVSVDTTVAESAGIIYADILSRRSKFGMVEAMILPTARVHKTTLLTFDSDFRGLPGVVLLKR